MLFFSFYSVSSTYDNIKGFFLSFVTLLLFIYLLSGETSLNLKAFSIWIWLWQAGVTDNKYCNSWWNYNFAYLYLERRERKDLVELTFIYKWIPFDLNLPRLQKVMYYIIFPTLILFYSSWTTNGEVNNNRIIHAKKLFILALCIFFFNGIRRQNDAILISRVPSRSIACALHAGKVVGLQIKKINK